MVTLHGAMIKNAQGHAPTCAVYFHAVLLNPGELAPNFIAPMLALGLLDPLFVFHKLLIRHRIFHLG
jgi:hypothetical protein